MHVFDIQSRELALDLFSQGGPSLPRRGFAKGNKAGFEASEGVIGRAWSRILLAIEQQRAVGVKYWDDRTVEATFFDSYFGSALRFCSELVEGTPGNVFECGDRIGADALVTLRMKRIEMGITAVHTAGWIVAITFARRHHFGATSDHQIFHA